MAYTICRYVEHIYCAVILGSVCTWRVERGGRTGECSLYPSLKKLSVIQRLETMNIDEFMNTKWMADSDDTVDVSVKHTERINGFGLHFGSG